MKQEARLFPDGRTNNVIARNIGAASEAVMAQLPSMESMRRDVRRNRQSVLNVPPIPDADDYR